MPKSTAWDAQGRNGSLLESGALGLKYNCGNKRMIKEVADAVEVVLHATYLMLPSLWSWESSVSFLLLVLLCLYFSFSGQGKVNSSNDSKILGC